MELDLGGKVALVTGASRGIGRGIALRLSREGMRVGIAARDAQRLESVAAEMGGEALVFAADLSQHQTPGEFVERAAQRWGRVDLVVNNAGATPRGDFLTLSDADWASGYGLKFFGAMRMCRSAWPWLARSGGSIINIAGVGGRAGSAEFTLGGSVNAALMHLTKSLADRGVGEGVRVNCINPGAIRTERLETRIRRVMERDGIAYPEAEQRLLAEMGVARFGEVEEIAEAVAFLASPRAGYWQGAVIDVDGGWTRGL